MISTMLGWLGWRGGAALALAMALVVAVVWVSDLRRDRDAARQEAALLAETARRNAAAVDAVARLAARDMAAVAAAHDARLARRARRTETERMIDATPKTRACADSPAVRLVLERLRQPAGDSAGSADRP